MKFYRCWAGTKHPAVNIPEDATDDTPLRFSCSCMGSLAQHPDVAKALETRESIPMWEARAIGERNPPPRWPVVRVGDLESE
jgi:hypothetical protein